MRALAILIAVGVLVLGVFAGVHAAQDKKSRPSPAANIKAVVLFF